MTHRARCERTERILIARLEELARLVERSDVRTETIARLLESASVATTNAVALDLLTSDAATEIWRAAETRHPEIVPLRRAAEPLRRAA